MTPGVREDRRWDSVESHGAFAVDPKPISRKPDCNLVRRVMVRERAHGPLARLGQTFSIPGITVRLPFAVRRNRLGD